ncbi:MAG: GNAT family N-acetyltransferase [Pseudomonadota bacterium]
MTAALHLAGSEDADRCVALAAAAISERGGTPDAEVLRDAIDPLLAGTPHGALYLIGPRKSPVGFLAVSFGWSVAEGGLVARIDEIFIREGVRGRGMGSEVLAALLPRLEGAGIRSVHAVAETANAGLQRLFARHGFAARAEHVILTRRAD